MLVSDSSPTADPDCALSSGSLGNVSDLSVVFLFSSTIKQSSDLNID